jgi:hypothetical protein
MAMSAQPAVKRYALSSLLPSKLVGVTYKLDITQVSLTILHKIFCDIEQKDINIYIGVLDLDNARSAAGIP